MAATQIFMNLLNTSRESIYIYMRVTLVVIRSIQFGLQLENGLHHAYVWIA